MTADDLRAYLTAKKFGPLSKDNWRRVIVALFNHAKESGWLPKNESTAADALKPYKSGKADVEIYTPGEVAELLSHAETTLSHGSRLSPLAASGMRNWQGPRMGVYRLRQGRLCCARGDRQDARKRMVDMAPISGLAHAIPWQDWPDLTIEPLRGSKRPPRRPA